MQLLRLDTGEVECQLSASAPLGDVAEAQIRLCSGDASIRENDLGSDQIAEREPEAGDQRSVAATELSPVIPTELHEPVTTASPRGSVTAKTSEARAPPEIRAERLSGLKVTSFIAVRSITMPSHNARPAQS